MPSLIVHRWLSFSLPAVSPSLSPLLSPSSAILRAAGCSSCGGLVPSRPSVMVEFQVFHQTHWCLPWWLFLSDILFSASVLDQFQKRFAPVRLHQLLLIQYTLSQFQILCLIHYPQENHHRHHQINQKVVLGFLRNNCCSFFCRVSHLPEIRHIIKSLISLQSAQRTDPKVLVSGPLKFKTLKCSVTQIYKLFNYTHTRKFYFLLHL